MTKYTWTVQWQCQCQWMHVVNWLLVLARRCHLFVKTLYSNDEIKYYDNNDDKLDLLQFYQ